MKLNWPLIYIFFSDPYGIGQFGYFGGQGPLLNSNTLNQILQFGQRLVGQPNTLQQPFNTFGQQPFGQQGFSTFGMQQPFGTTGFGSQLRFKKKK